MIDASAFGTLELRIIKKKRTFHHHAQMMVFFLQIDLFKMHLESDRLGEIPKNVECQTVRCEVVDLNVLPCQLN